jgi:hypothetical protein
VVVWVEEYRNTILLDGMEEFRSFLEQTVAAEFPHGNNWRAAGDLYFEAARRMFKMCDIDIGN